MGRYFLHRSKGLLKPLFSLTKINCRTIIIRSTFDDVDLPEGKSFPQFMLERFEQFPDRIAMINSHDGRSCKYGEIRGMVNGISVSFFKRGLKQNDVMCFLSRNSFELYVTCLGVQNIGGTMTGLNPAFTESEMLRQLKDAQASYITTTPDLLPKAEKVANSYSNIKDIFVIGESGVGHDSIHDFMEEKGEVPQVKINPREDTAFLFYSSGTTGLPKGVRTTHYNLIAAAALSGTSESWIFREGPHCTGNFLPMFHNSGFIVAGTKSLYIGNTVVVIPKYEIEEYLGLIQKYKIRTTLTTPNILSHIAIYPHLERFDLSSHDTFLVGGAPVGPNAFHIMQKLLGIKYISVGYGCTEGSGVSHVTSHKDTTKLKLGSSGILQPNMEVKVMDIDTGKELGYNETGEIWKRGPLVMKGFLNNPKADEEALTEDGWLKTGDIGYCDEETNIYIIDRLKDFIKCKGFQVAPAELEDWLVSHPAVVEAAVVGIPDSRVGEAPRAYVVLKPGITVTEEDLINYTNAKVAPYKHLRAGVVFLRELPKTPTGKVQRRLLKDQAFEKETSLEDVGPVLSHLGFP